jgi:hypothetical protein
MKKIIVTKPKEVKTGSNLEESSKEGCGSKRALLRMMMIYGITYFLVPGRTAESEDGG